MGQTYTRPEPVPDGASAEVEVKIPRAAVEPIENVIVYQIVLAYRGCVWTVMRRFSEVMTLHSRILSVLPECGLESLLPPPRTLFRTMDPSFVESRRVQLEEYLMALCARPEVWQSAIRPMGEFFEVSTVSFGRALGRKGKEGWLWKRPGGYRLRPAPSGSLDGEGLFSTWRRRWFVLKDSCLLCFLHPGAAQPLDVFLVGRGFRVTRFPGSGRELRVVSPTRDLVVAGGTRREAEEWLAAMHSFYSSNVAGLQSVMERAAADVGVPAVMEAASGRVGGEPPGEATSKNPLGTFALARAKTRTVPLTSGRAYFAAVARALLDARSQIVIAAWWLDPFLPLIRPARENGAPTTPRASEMAVFSEGSPRRRPREGVQTADRDITDDPDRWLRNPLRLSDILRLKAMQGVEIYVMLYAEVEATGLPTAARRATEALAKLHPSRIHTVRHPLHSLPLGRQTGHCMAYSHHEKIVLVDQLVGFVGGIDLAPGRYDDIQHPIADASESVWTGRDFHNASIAASTIRAELGSDAPDTDLVAAAANPETPEPDPLQVAQLGDRARRVTASLLSHNLQANPKTPEVGGPPAEPNPHKPRDPKTPEVGGPPPKPVFHTPERRTISERPLLETEEEEEDGAFFVRGGDDGDDFVREDDEEGDEDEDGDEDKPKPKSKPEPKPPKNNSTSRTNSSNAKTPEVGGPAPRKGSKKGAGLFESPPPRPPMTKRMKWSPLTPAAKAAARRVHGGAALEPPPDRPRGGLDPRVHPRMPWHDVAVAVGPPASLDLAFHLAERWNHHVVVVQETLPLLVPWSDVSRWWAEPVEAFGPRPGFSRVGDTAKDCAATALAAGAGFVEGDLNVEDPEAREELRARLLLVEARMRAATVASCPRSFARLLARPAPDVSRIPSTGTSLAQEVAAAAADSFSRGPLAANFPVTDAASPSTSSSSAAAKPSTAMLRRTSAWHGTEALTLSSSRAWEGHGACVSLRSVGSWSLGLPRRPETSITDGMCRVIESARHLVYMENQFFISSVGGHGIKNPVAEALYRRIRAAIRDRQLFRAILLFPAQPEGDVTSNVAMQAVVHYQLATLSRGPDSLLGRLRLEFPDVDLWEYITVCALRTCGTVGALDDDVEDDSTPRKQQEEQSDEEEASSSTPKKQNSRKSRLFAGRLATEQVYVHSKVLIVDDRVAIVGSANVNDRSLLGERDTEFSVMLSGGGEAREDEADASGVDGPVAAMGGKTFKVSPAVAMLRRQLWRAHLGLEDHLSDASLARAEHERQVDALVGAPTPEKGAGPRSALERRIDELLRDPVCDETYRGLWQGTALWNTAYYEREFPGTAQLTSFEAWRRDLVSPEASLSRRPPPPPTARGIFRWATNSSDKRVPTVSSGVDRAHRAEQPSAANTDAAQGLVLPFEQWSPSWDQVALPVPPHIACFADAPDPTPDTPVIEYADKDTTAALTESTAAMAKHTEEKDLVRLGVYFRPRAPTRPPPHAPLVRLPLGQADPHNPVGKPVGFLVWGSLAYMLGADLEPPILSRERLVGREVFQ